MGLGAEVSADSDREKNTLSTGQSSSRSISGPNMPKIEKSIKLVDKVLKRLECSLILEPKFECVS